MMCAVLRIAACELQRLSFSTVSISSSKVRFSLRLHQDVETRISRGVWKSLYPSTGRVDLAPPPLCKGAAALDQEEAAKLQMMESAPVPFKGKPDSRSGR